MLRLKRLVPVLAALLALLVAGCGTSGTPRVSSNQEPTSTPLPPTNTPIPPVPPTSTPSPEGVRVIEPPQVITDFTLTSHRNEPFKLSDLRGKLVLLAFGYTHCPDICPVTLAHLKQVKLLLGEAASQIQVVFISVDGARDTPDRMAYYLAMFDPEFMGLTGEEKAVRAIITEFGGTFNIKNAGGLRDNYPVEHTTGSFLLNLQGRYIRRYLYEAAPEAVAAELLPVIKSLTKAGANAS